MFDVYTNCGKSKVLYVTRFCKMDHLPATSEMHFIAAESYHSCTSDRTTTDGQVCDPFPYNYRFSMIQILMLYNICVCLFVKQLQSRLLWYV